MFTGRAEDLGRKVSGDPRCRRESAVRARRPQRENCRIMVEVAEREFGPLTTLVNNAAATHMIGTVHPLADRRMHLLSNETLDIMWKSDLYGLFWCCRYALRAMLTHKRQGCRSSIFPPAQAVVAAPIWTPMPPQGRDERSHAIDGG